MDATKILKQAEARFDDGDLEQGIRLCRNVLAEDANHLLALHFLNWAMDSLIKAGDRKDLASLVEEQRHLRTHILSTTEQLNSLDAKVKPSGVRARAFALYQRARERFRSRTEVEAAVKDATEASKLRPDAEFYEKLPLWAKAMHALSASNGEKGFNSVLEMLSKDLGADGLDQVFEEPLFVAWLKEKAKHPLQANPPKRAKLNDALLKNAGQHNHSEAPRSGRVGRLAALLALGASVDASDDDSQAIHHLAELGDIASAEFLLEMGASLEALGKRGERPLHYAAAESQDPMIEFLVDKGADVMARSTLGRTPLHAAALALRTPPETFELLLRLGADINAQDKGGSTALHFVAEFNHGAVPVLLHHSADLSLKDAKGRTAFNLAVKSGKGDLAKQLKPASSPKKVAPGAPDLSAVAVLFKKTKFPKYLQKPLKELVEALALQEPDSWDQVAEVLAGKQGTVILAFLKLVKATLVAPVPAATEKNPAGFFLGDVRVPGNTNILGPLFVLGDLIVEGTLADAGDDSTLVVAGNLTAHALNTDGELAVGGDLVARDLVYAWYNDYAFTVEGTARTQLLVIDDREWSVGKVAAEHFFPDGQSDAAQIAERLVPNLVKKTKNGVQIDWEKLWKQAQQGHAVLANPMQQ